MRNGIKCMLNRWPAIAIGVIAAGVSSQAATISFMGDLRTDASFLACGSGCTLGPGNTDAEYAQWTAFSADFNVPVSSLMTAITFSYGGGTNGNGAAIAQNGFEPYLSLFVASGAFLTSTFFETNCPSGANINSDSGECFDVQLDGGFLAPGDYSIAISAFQNMSFAENAGLGTLADGFTGLGSLAFGEDLHFAFDVSLTPATTVPEPGSAAVISTTCLAWYLATRRSRRT